MQMSRSSVQVITHVTVIDPRVGADERRHMTVVVRGNQIEALGPSSKTPIPPGAFFHDASGRYLIPGLLDAHVHLNQTGPRDFPSPPCSIPAYGQL